MIATRTLTFNYEEAAKMADKIAIYFIKRFPGRHYVSEITFWDDGDYAITIHSSWGNITDKVIFKKSNGKPVYRQEMEKNDFYSMGKEIELEELENGT